MVHADTVQQGGVGRRVFRLLACALATAAVGCSTVNLGVSVPVGPNAGIGISVGTDGRIGVGVGVSAGGGTVSVGTSGKLPTEKKVEPEPASP